MVNKTIIYPHLGMGDHFTCNGLIHYLSERYDEVHLICKNYTVPTITHLYENYPKFKIVKIDNEPEDVISYSRDNDLPVLKIGFEYTDPNNFERSFYSQYGLDLEEKYNRFRLPTNLDNSKLFYLDTLNKLGQDYLFVHDLSTYGHYELNIDSTLPRYIVNKDDTLDILDYVHTIINAKEIHFINSGLYPLISLLYKLSMIKTDKIYFHNIRKFYEGGLKIEYPKEFIKVDY
jgi:hypothetical protein